VEEIPISDLTDRFEMTEESVKSRLKRARAQVREKLIARSAA
jgi:DNA-directed RNA polymerase specialized sigma24 family protein